MSLTMHNLKPSKGSRNKRKRLGRGNASGKGTTAARGTKGQAARTGGRNRRKLRGLRQIMLATPKLRGFKSLKPSADTLRLMVVANSFKDNEIVTPASLVKKGLIQNTKNGVKIVSGAKITNKLTIKGCSVSASVKTAIEEAGGSVSVK